MAYYTEEQIKQARSIDLLTYLQTQEPTELVKLKGDTYCTREHDSLKISNGKWLSEPMLSLGGVYEPNKDPSKWKLPVALQNMLQDHPEVTSIALHLDNDAAGKSAAWAIEGLLRDKYNVSYEPPPCGKDFNDYLMSIRGRIIPERAGPIQYDHMR